MDEAMDLLRPRQPPDGTCLLENTHPGRVHFAIEEGDGRVQAGDACCACPFPGLEAVS
jgi:hypothetical protein